MEDNKIKTYPLRVIESEWNKFLSLCKDKRGVAGVEILREFISDVVADPENNPYLKKNRVSQKD